MMHITCVYCLHMESNTMVLQDKQHVTQSIIDYRELWCVVGDLRCLLSSLACVLQPAARIVCSRLLQLVLVVASRVSDSSTFSPSPHSMHVIT